MELRQLRYFLAVAEELHFTRAARRLYVSQSTLSEQIGALEHEVGGRLFDRDSRSVRLSEAGARLVEPARAALAAADTALAEARQALPPRTVTAIRLGVTTDPPVPLVEAIAEEWWRRHPRVRLHLVPVPLVSPVEDLADGTIDALVTWQPFDEERFQCTPLLDEPQVLGMRWDHPLAETSRVWVEQMLDEPTLRPHPGIPRDFADFWCYAERRGGLTPQFVGEPVVQAHDSLVSVLYAGAVAPVYRSFADAAPAGHLVVFRPLLDAPGCRLVLATRRGDHRPAVAALQALGATVASPVLHRLR